MSEADRLYAIAIKAVDDRKRVEVDNLLADLLKNCEEAAKKGLFKYTVDVPVSLSTTAKERAEQIVSGAQAVAISLPRGKSGIRLNWGAAERVTVRARTGAHHKRKASDPANDEPPAKKAHTAS